MGVGTPQRVMSTNIDVKALRREKAIWNSVLTGLGETKGSVIPFGATWDSFV
jgi:hypothetical protein